MEPVKGSVAYAEQQTAMDYGVPSFVIADAAWAKNKGNIPAFSVGGQIFFRETMPEKCRGMFAPHEITHVMKQVGYTPYLDFVAKTPDLLDTSLSEADRRILYDEINATLYGHIGSEKMDGLTEVLDRVFYDFEAYSKALRELYEQFKADNKKETKFSLKAGTETQTAAALHEEERLLREQTRELAQLQKENRALTERRDYWKGQTQRTKQVATDKKAVAKAAKALVQRYGAKLDGAEITPRPSPPAPSWPQFWRRISPGKQTPLVKPPKKAGIRPEKAAKTPQNASKNVHPIP